MTLRWYQVQLCKPCADGSLARCTEPGCAFWARQSGWGFGDEFSKVALTSAQVNALDVAREFEGGLA